MSAAKLITVVVLAVLAAAYARHGHALAGILLGVVTLALIAHDAWTYE